MKSVIYNNILTQQIMRINSQLTTHRKGDIIRAKIQSIDRNGVLIKLSNGQTLLARVEGQCAFKAGNWVYFEILEWTRQMVKLKPLDKFMLAPLGQIGQYMEMLGLTKTPENEALLYYMLLQGIPLNKENVLFFMNKHFKLSMRIRLLMRAAVREGLTEHVQAMDNALLRLETLAEFLKNPSSNISEFHYKIVDLCERFMKEDINEEMRSFIKDIFTGILLQMNEELPFKMMQLPIKIDEQLLDSGIWLDRESDVLYMEITLPRLGTTECLLKDWKSKANIAFYCDSAYHSAIMSEIETLRQGLMAIGLKVKKIEIYNILEHHGLRDFLKRYWNEQETIDVKV